MGVLAAPPVRWIARKQWPAFVKRLSLAATMAAGIGCALGVTDDSADATAARYQASFQPFAPLVATRHDASFFYVESTGMPDHRMMVGITAWQQQVPLPQSYPVAYAVDGYAIHGLSEPDGSSAASLDSFNGHTGADGRYHYHATKTYLYLNGGFHGEVLEREGQVDPQPRAEPIRPAAEPLRGAIITGFEKLAANIFTLSYLYRGETRKIHYTIEPDGRYVFEYLGGRGQSRTETYSRRDRFVR